MFVASWGFPLFQERIHLHSQFPASNISLPERRTCLCGKLQLSQIKLLTRVCSVFLLVFSHALHRYLEIFPRNVFISPSIILSSHCLPQSVSLILLDDKKPCVRHLVPPPTWTHECFSGDQPIPSDPMSVMVWDFEKTFSHTQCSTLTPLTFAL